jgi:hypothetical protein
MRAAVLLNILAVATIAGLASRASAQPTPANVSRALAPAAVSGTLRTGAGAAIPWARVTLFRSDLSYFAEVRSDGRGVYRLDAAPMGVYRLGVAAPGWGYQEAAVEIEDVGIVRNFTLAPESHPGAWTIIGNTAPQTYDASDIGILLADGRVMYCHDTLTPMIFDPTSGLAAPAANSGLPQGCMNITLLADGRAIFVGGQPGSEPGQFRNAVRYVKTYNPATNAWVRHADLLNPTGRWYPGTARLADGSLLAMGGGTCCNAVRTATCEWLNPATMTWSWTGSMLNPSEFTPAALLYTGEVLITWSPPQLFSPATGQWRATGNFVQPARGWPDHSDHSLIMLDDGRAVAIGIERAGGAGYTAMAEIYNPANETWSLGTSPALLREKPEVVPLPDGKVQVAAGDTELSNPGVPNVRGVVKWTDLYDPLSDGWRRVADMNQFREYHAVSLLVPDGRVLTTGGTVIDFQNSPTSSDVEAFSPPYLFRGVRPQITNLSTTVPQPGVPVTATVFPATRITSAVLIGTGAATHWVDSGVPRRLVLPVAQSGNTVMFNMPDGRTILPAGHYMLFLMVDDIPSAARIVRVL